MTTERKLINRRQIKEIFKSKRHKFYRLSKPPPAPDAVDLVTGHYLYYLDRVKKIIEGDEDTLL